MDITRNIARNISTITHRPGPVATALAAFAAFAVVGTGPVAASPGSAVPSMSGTHAGHLEASGFRRSIYDRPTTGGWIMVGP